MYSVSGNLAKIDGRHGKYDGKVNDVDVRYGRNANDNYKTYIQDIGNHSKQVPLQFEYRYMPDGKFIYKLIKPADRKHLRAILSRTDDNKFTAVTDEGTVYFLNQAAVTFFKGTPGDELYIIINEKDKGSFAAIEAIIKK